jgi:hypothetical protein
MNGRYFNGLDGAQGRNRTTDTAIFSHALNERFQSLGLSSAVSRTVAESIGYVRIVYALPATQILYRGVA